MNEKYVMCCNVLQRRLLRRKEWARPKRGVGDCCMFGGIGSMCSMAGMG